MKVNNYTGSGGCGGGRTTTRIMINVYNMINKTHYDSESVCHTKAIQYPTGKTVVWKSDDQLQDCADIKFDPKEPKIYYTIKPTNKYMDYCIDEVAVILDDEQSTKYMKETDDKWRKDVSETFFLTKQ